MCVLVYRNKKDNKQMKDAAICIRIGEPDCSDLVEEEYDWKSTVYGEVSVILPKDTPVPLSNFIMLSHYVDANLYHKYVDKQIGNRHTSLPEQDAY